MWDIRHDGTVCHWREVAEPRFRSIWEKTEVWHLSVSLGGAHIWVIFWSHPSHMLASVAKLALCIWTMCNVADLSLRDCILCNDNSIHPITNRLVVFRVTGVLEPIPASWARQGTPWIDGIANVLYFPYYHIYTYQTKRSLKLHNWIVFPINYSSIWRALWRSVHQMLKYKIGCLHLKALVE